MVATAFKFRTLGPPDCEVPFEQVVVQGLSEVHGCRFSELNGLFHQPLHS